MKAGVFAKDTIWINVKTGGGNQLSERLTGALPQGWYFLHCSMFFWSPEHRIGIMSVYETEEVQVHGKGVVESQPWFLCIAGVSMTSRSFRVCIQAIPEEIHCISTNDIL